MLVFSVVAGEMIFLGAGAVGVFLFVPQIVLRYFGDELGAPVALFLAGVLLLGLSAVVAKLRPRVTARSER
jgi:hypothetical protein